MAKSTYAVLRPRNVLSVEDEIFINREDLVLVKLVHSVFDPAFVSGTVIFDEDGDAWLKMSDGSEKRVVVR